MKKVWLPTLLVLLLLAVAPAAWAGRIEIRHHGSPWVTVEADGTVRLRGGQVGSFDEDGTVRNPGGSRLGKVDGDGTLRDASGAAVAQMETNGTLRYGGVAVGAIAGDGTIRRRGREWGRATPCSTPADRHRAAAVLLFFSTFFDEP